MKKYKGYFLYYIKKGPKPYSLKYCQFENKTREEVITLSKLYTDNPEKYIYKGAKIVSE